MRFKLGVFGINSPEKGSFLPSLERSYGFYRGC
jgi:hypothetical protein